MNTLETQLMDAVRESKKDEVLALLEKGCKVDVGDVNNLTPLHLAAMRNNEEIAELLIERGANVNSKTTDKLAPLHYAAAKGFPDIVAVLIHGGASIDLLDASDRTPLMLAVTRGRAETVELLITYGAKVNIEEIHGYTPLCEAVWSKSVEIASMLLKAGAKLTQSQFLLHYAVLHRHVAMAELLLKYGAYPNLRDDRGDTPLLLAISSREVDMIRLLLQYGADVNVSDYGEDDSDSDDDSEDGMGIIPFSLRQSSLKMALRMKDPELVYLIVAAGFDMSRHTAAFPEDFSQVNTNSLSGWLTYMKFNPRRLMDLCRLQIRSQMGSKVLHLVPKLEIPQSLKQFLLLQDNQFSKLSDTSLADFQDSSEDEF